MRLNRRSFWGWMGITLFLSLSASAQSALPSAIRSHVESAEIHTQRWHQAKFQFSANPIRLLANSAMYLYQQVITYHINAECMYHPSCSEFSRQAIAEYGMLKGGLLTLDRLTRCNGLERRTRGMRRAKDGRWNDPISNYAGR